MKRIDLTGQRFGRYEVLHEVKKRGIQRYYKCKCDCGTIKEVSQSNLRRGCSKSCGCLRDELRKVDLTGKRFGLLTVVKRVGMKKRRTMWEVICDCGNTRILPYTSIAFGGTRSCGCLKKQSAKEVMSKAREPLIVEGVHTYALTRRVYSDSKTGVKGVTMYFTKKGEERFVAGIGIKGKRYRLGTYKTLEEAVAARRKAEELYHQPYLQKIKQKPPTTP